MSVYVNIDRLMDLTNAGSDFDVERLRLEK